MLVRGANHPSLRPALLSSNKHLYSFFSFPSPQGSSREVRVSLNEVMHATTKLQEECRKTPGHSDLAYRTRLIINSAYDVAKACRHLVMCVEQDAEKDS